MSSGLSKSSKPRLDKKSGMVSYEGASQRELRVRLSLLMLPTLCVFSSRLLGREHPEEGGVLAVAVSGEE